MLSCHFPETDIADMLLFNLDILGVACSGGSACASGGSKGSHVLSALTPDSKRPGIRFSFSKYTTKSDIDFTVEKLKELFEKDYAKASSIVSNKLAEINAKASKAQSMLGEYMPSSKSALWTISI